MSVLGLPVETSLLSGGGTVDGDVKVVADGVLNVTGASGGSVGTLVVSGTADFSEAGAVEIGGVASALEPGKYLLLSADKLVSPEEWTVSGGRSTCIYSVSVIDDALYLTVARPGMMILVR